MFISQILGLLPTFNFQTHNTHNLCLFQFVFSILQTGVLRDVSLYFKIVKANIYEADSMVEGMTGKDVVLSCLGTQPSLFSRRKITFYTDTAKHIVAALRKASVNRFIFMASVFSVCKYISINQNAGKRNLWLIMIINCDVVACSRQSNWFWRQSNIIMLQFGVW